MSGSRRGIFERLKSSKLFRRAYVREIVKQGIAHQIRSMREIRNMKQIELAALCGKSQSNIARWEDPDYGKYTLQTLLEVADAFDVFLSIQFVSFKEGLRRTNDKTVDGLNARSFCEDDSVWATEQPILTRRIEGVFMGDRSTAPQTTTNPHRPSSSISKDGVLVAGTHLTVH